MYLCTVDVSAYVVVRAIVSKANLNHIFVHEIGAWIIAGHSGLDDGLKREHMGMRALNVRACKIICTCIYMSCISTHANLSICA